MKTPALLLPRTLALALGAAGLLALASCMDHYPLDPNRTIPLFDHDLSGALLSGSGTTSVTDGVFTFSDWENAGQISFIVKTASDETIATLRVMNDDEDLFISVRTQKPLSGANQDVFTIQLESGGETVVYGLDRGEFFDEYCETLIGDHPSDCDSGFESHGAGQRLGSGGATTYETSMPLSVFGLDVDDVVNARLIFTPGGAAATTVWPATGWSQIRIAHFDDEDDEIFDDPLRPNVTVIVEDAACAVSVVLRSELEYRLQRAEETVPGTCQTTFFNLEPGTSPVISALNAILTHPGQREIWPTNELIPHFPAPPLREGAVMVQPAEAIVFGQGTSERLIPPNYYLAFERRKPLPTAEQMADLHFTGVKNPEITLALQYGFAKSVNILGLPTGSQAFAVLPYDPDKVFPTFAQGTPGGGVFANTPSNPTTMIVGFDENTDDHETVFTAVDPDGNVYSGTWDGNSPDVTLFPAPDCFHSEYVVDPRNDGHPDISLVTYCTEKERDTEGNIVLDGGQPRQSDSFAVNWNVHGLSTPRNRRPPFSRWQLDVLVPTATGEQTVRVIVYCEESKDCERQEVHPRSWANKVDVDGSVDGDGNGYARVVLDFSGVNQARLRVRGADNDSNNDFAPDDGLTQAPNIVDGWALWERPTLPSTSWSVRF
jgi:hypothetical protein